MQTNSAMTAILAERRRQIEVEGWTPEHDDAHVDGEMLNAAVIYLWWGTDRAAPATASKASPMGWPWDNNWWKPKDRRSNLVRAGALCLAEKDRLVRAGRTFTHAEHKLDIAVRELTALDA